MDIKVLHRIQLEALKAFDEFCRAHSLTYSLIAGSLLGAIRHDGFIPWDDDVDVGMPRLEYERFLKLAHSEGFGQGKLFLQHFGTESNFHLVYSKLRIRGTRFTEEGTSSLSIDHGIFIDIFPFDTSPDRLSLRCAHRILFHSVKKMLLAKAGYAPSQPVRALAYRILRILLYPVPLPTVQGLAKRSCTAFKFCESTHLVNLGGSYSYLKESIPRRYFDDLVTLKFEGLEVLAFADWHEYLRTLYGDYTELPPIAERVARHLK